MARSRKSLELTLNHIEELDNKMIIHQNNCFKCSEAPCKKWEDMVLHWNYLYTALNRATKNHMEDTYE